MNMRIFAESLTIHEVNELSNILYEIKKAYAKENLVPCNANEVNLYYMNGTISAIKAHRERNGSSLLEAKLAVEMIGPFYSGLVRDR